MADPNPQTADSQSNAHIVYIWKIPFDRTYVKSHISILKVAAAFLSLIAFICVASGRSDTCDDSYSSTYNYFDFVAISAFITVMILWFFFALTLVSRLFFKMVPWKLVDLVYCCVYIILYLIANICLAAQSCDKDSNKAGVAFGFFAMFCFCGNAFFAFQNWRESREDLKPPERSADYNPERNMEQY